MNTRSFWLMLGAVGVVCIVAMPLSPAVVASARGARVVLVFDVSGSFKKYHEQAWARIDQDLKRLRRTASDELVLVKLDGQPEIVFDGKMEQIKKARARFAELGTLSTGCCTDVVGALNLAAFRLTQAPLPARKEIWLVSDLVHEPKGRPVPLPEEAVDWNGLKDAAIRVYFIPPAQAMTWRGIFEKHGVAAEFFNPAQSEEIIVAPSARVAARAGGSFLLSLVKLAGIFLAGVFLWTTGPRLARSLMARFTARRGTT